MTRTDPLGLDIAHGWTNFDSAARPTETRHLEEVLAGPLFDQIEPPAAETLWRQIAHRSSRHLDRELPCCEGCPPEDSHPEAAVVCRGSHSDPSPANWLILCQNCLPEARDRSRAMLKGWALPLGVRPTLVHVLYRGVPAILTDDGQMFYAVTGEPGKHRA